jgi:outer membrane protein
MKHIRVFAGALALALAGPAVAADLPSRGLPPAPTLAFESYKPFDPFMIRVRAMGILTDSSARVWAGGAPVPGGSLKVSNAIVPAIDFSYFITRNIAVEAICCVSPHRIRGAGALAGADVGRTRVVSPTLTLQYHFADFGAFKPYVGVGGTWTHYFYDRAGPGFTNFNVKNSVGPVAQMGFDYMIDRNWGFNIDLKRLMVRPNASALLGGAVPVQARLKIDPWLASVGLTYRFGGSSPVLVARH